MKSFLKYLLATIVGILITSLLLFVILMGVVGSITSKSDEPVEVKSNSILKITFGKEIVDRAPKMPFDFGPFKENTPMGLNDILNNIKKAKDDENIEGIYINMKGIAAGMATIEEIRGALIDFKESGKFVITYAENYSQGSYYLASVSDKVYMNPSGLFIIVGVRAEKMYFRNTLDKIGVEPKIFSAGSYKSFGEQYSRDNMSDADREQMTVLINSIWDKWVEDITLSRGLTADRVNEIASKLLIKDAEDAVAYGLIDSLIFQDAILEILKEKLDIADEDKISAINFSDYTKVASKKSYKGLAKEKVAVIYASGTIHGGEGDETSIGSDKYLKTIRKARKDSTIKAVVLRVNSPGGGGLASRVIMRELELTREVKPVIVSMGDVAASGGYYISCIADTILANRQTITGSIGVVATLFTSEELFSKLGLSFDRVKTNEFADFLSPTRPMKAEEAAFLQNHIDKFYKVFITDVANGRNTSTDAIDKVAQGRVWTGTNAKDINLIDEFGGLTTAIDLAAKLANIEDKYRVVELPKLEDPFEKLLKQISTEARVGKVLHNLGISAQEYQWLKSMLTQEGVQTIMPYSLSIY